MDKPAKRVNRGPKPLTGAQAERLSKLFLGLRQVRQARQPQRLSGQSGTVGTLRN